jgi:hypothetical protein
MKRALIQPFTNDAENLLCDIHNPTEKNLTHEQN